MGLRGRAKTPSAIVKMRGNPGNLRLNPAEPIGRVFREPPPCPKGLDARTRKHWRRLAKAFSGVRVLQDTDLPALQKLAYECARLEEVQEKLSKSGFLYRAKTGPAVSPLFKVMVDLSQIVDRGLRQFGATPASRTSITAASPAKATDKILEMIG